MRSLTFRVFTRVNVLALLLAGATAAITAAAPASASPLGPADIGSDWIQQSLPAGYSIGVPLPGNPMDPVSCVAGTSFCAVIVNDQASTPEGQAEDNQAVYVRSDGSWTMSEDLPTGGQFVSISCPTTSICYAAGTGMPSNVQTVVVSTDGGQTWNPTAQQISGGLVNAIDCVSASTCYLAFGRFGAGGIAYTLDSGNSWHGAYETAGSTGVYDIWCTPPTSPGAPFPSSSCVAVGGTNNENGGQALVLTGGGISWQASTAPVLNEISTLFGVSCAPTASSSLTCYAVGASDNSSGTEGGSVELVSADGGQTWTGNEFVADKGWLQSVSCADATDCWAGGAGTQLALTGTADGGNTWYPENVSGTNQLNNVSCASVDFCVATADNKLWLTSDDGGIATAPAPDPSITAPLPPLTPPSVTTNAGAAKTVIGQDRQSNVGVSMQTSIRLPDGHIVRSTTKVGKFCFYSLRVRSIPIGATHVRFTVAGQTVDYVVVHGKQTGPAVRPRFVSAGKATFTTGTKSSFIVKVSGSPQPWLWETGKLPKGITFHPVTGILSGWPARTAAGTYRLTFTASNGVAPDAIQHFVLTVIKRQ
jgi:hypothetical protein